MWCGCLVCFVAFALVCLVCGLLLVMLFGCGYAGICCVVFLNVCFAGWVCLVVLGLAGMSLGGALWVVGWFAVFVVWLLIWFTVCACLVCFLFGGLVVVGRY